MTFTLTRHPDGRQWDAPTLEDAQQLANGAAEGPLHWSASGGDSWEATDPETGLIYLIELALVPA